MKTKMDTDLDIIFSACIAINLNHEAASIIMNTIKKGKFITSKERAARVAFLFEFGEKMNTMDQLVYAKKLAFLHRKLDIRHASTTIQNLGPATMNYEHQKHQLFK